ncbi:MAG: peroxiredoxin [Bacteroidales bacterium]|nr:peroxiredoxin [Bacteroidales bacterium]
MIILENIWLILFIAWGLPLTFYRSKFRKIVYQTDSWTINIKPYFWKELKALFGNLYPDDKNYLKFRNFYRFYLIIYLLLFVSYLTFHKSNAMNELKIGSTVPSFTLPDQNGNLFDINSVLGKKNLVIYFYPKDDSPGCTAQACSFRDQFEIFSEADAVIIGISGQSVESHKEFAKKHRLTFTLLSDEGNKIRKLFGVPTNLLGLLPGRVTYVADKTGKVIYIFNSQINATKHVDEALRILKASK